MSLSEIHWAWWVAGAAILLVALAVVIALVIWIRMVVWQRSFTAVTGCAFQHRPDELWGVLLEPESGGEEGATPAPIVDAFDWLIEDERSDAVPAGGVRLAWTVLEDARPESMVLRYEAPGAGLRGIVELQIDPGDPDASDPEAGPTPSGPSQSGPSRLVVIHHCDPTWREGAVLARRAEREHAFGDALLRRVARALGIEEPAELEYFGVQNVRGPIAA